MTPEQREELSKLRTYERELLVRVIEERDKLWARIAELESRATGEARWIRQQKVHAWCVAAFGSEQAASIPQRGLRMLEEAAETAQAAGVDLKQAHALLDYVWSRPIGELQQELGGLGLTVLALSEAARISADAAEIAEVRRVLSKPLEHFTRRNQAKNDAGFLAPPQPAALPEDSKEMNDANR